MAKGAIKLVENNHPKQLGTCFKDPGLGCLPLLRASHIFPSTLGYVEAYIDPYSLRNHAQLGGGSVAKRMISTLAYGWVERCSDVAGCGRVILQKISKSDYPISAVILMFNELL